MPASVDADAGRSASDIDGRAWDDSLLVGHEAIDREHRIFISLLRVMQSSGADALPDLLDDFAVHLERHFAQEEALMARHRFPAGGCHVEEHDKVRASLHEVRARVRGGDADIGRDLLRALAEWFPLHVQTMDAAVAQWTTLRTAGSRPVVLRRSPRTGTSTRIAAGSGDPS